MEKNTVWGDGEIYIVYAVYLKTDKVSLVSLQR